LNQNPQRFPHRTLNEMSAMDSVHTFPPTLRIVRALHAHSLANRQIHRRTATKVTSTNARVLVTPHAAHSPVALRTASSRGRSAIIIRITTSKTRKRRRHGSAQNTKTKSVPRRPRRTQARARTHPGIPQRPMPQEAQIIDERKRKPILGTVSEIRPQSSS